MMKPENISSPEDMARYIEGCLNDFEANISTKAETIDLMVDLMAYFLTKVKKQNIQDRIVNNGDPLI